MNASWSAFQHAPAFGLRLSARRLRRLVSFLVVEFFLFVREVGECE
jgi:hypothetical protein